MKLPVTYILILFCTLFKASAQKQCDFLGPLHFKNGKATVVVKATYLGFTETNNPEIITQLHKKKIVDGKKYADVGSKREGGIGGTDIDFAVDNCPTSYYGTVLRNINLNSIKDLQTIYIKCTVYQGLKNDRGLQYFMVDGITYSNKDLPKADKTGPFIYLKNPPNEENERRFSNADPNDCIITANPTEALMQTSDKKYHRFKFVKHTEKEDGYIDLYKNGDESIELNISRVINDGTFIARSLGKATATVNHVTTTFRINGFGDDNHHHQTK